MREPERGDQGCAHAFGEPCHDGARILLGAQVCRHQRFTGAHHTTGGAAVESDDQPFDRCRAAKRG